MTEKDRANATRIVVLPKGTPLLPATPNHGSAVLDHAFICVFIHSGTIKVDTISEEKHRGVMIKVCPPMVGCNVFQVALFTGARTK